MAETKVHYRNALAFVVAETAEAAYAAVQKIGIDIDALPVITDPREAREKANSLCRPARSGWG